MPTVPCHPNLFQSHQDFYQFLQGYKQDASDRNQRRIISISVEIDPVEPLAILDAFQDKETSHFYLEKKQASPRILNQKTDHFDSKFSMVAIGMAASLEIQAADRFQLARKFIDTCLRDTVTFADPALSVTGPYFLCSFAFFDHPLEPLSTDSEGIFSGDNFPAATIYLPRWHVISRQGTCILIANLIITPDLNLTALIHQVQTEFQLITSTRYQVNGLPTCSNKKLEWQDLAHTRNFKQAVAAAIDAIAEQHLEKIVLAHAIDVTSPLPFHLIQSLNHLRSLYPDCYVFSMRHREGPAFLGASPERLVSLFNQELVADALAGSAPRGKTAVEDSTLMSGLLVDQKERHEHQLVIQFITQCLECLGCELHRAQVPHLLQLSNIQHLRTLIQARVPSNVHLLEIVSQLHPTPAVAGLPREITCDYIRQLEAFDRGLYAGPLGWMDHRGNGEFIVGIRSALVHQRQARLYAGAGIVQGSNPDRELSEIRLKLQAMLNALI